MQVAEATGTELLLLVLWLACMGVAASGFNAAWDEAEKKVPLEFRQPHWIRFAIDPFVWSRSASRSLRRRYVVTQGFGVLGLAFFTAMIVQRFPHFAVLPAVVTLIAAGGLGWRCFRHGA
jgi:hypothetical protein